MIATLTTCLEISVGDIIKVFQAGEKHACKETCHGDKPVCGADGLSYPNICSLYCDGIELACDGSCPCSTSQEERVASFWTWLGFSEPSKYIQCSENLRPNRHCHEEINDDWKCDMKTGFCVEKDDDDKDSFWQDVKEGMQDVVDAGVEGFEDGIEAMAKAYPFQNDELKESCIPGVYNRRSSFGVVEDLMNNLSMDEVLLFANVLGDVTDFFDSMIGEEMTEEWFRKCHEVAKHYTGYPEKYSEIIQYAPFTLTPDQLKIMIANNPFLTTALSYIEPGRLCWDATPNSPNPLVAAVMDAMEYKGKNYAIASLCMDENLENMEVIIDGDGTYPHDHELFDHKIRAWVTCMMYFFESIHGSLHVLTFTMLQAVESAFEGSGYEGLIEQWQINVGVKYTEVAVILLKPDHGVMTGEFWQVNSDKFLAAAPEVFKLLAAQPTAQAWRENIFLSGDPNLINNPNLLPQLDWYIPMVESAADRITAKIPAKKLKKIDAGIKEYFSITAGEGKEGHFGYGTFHSWLQAQSMAGMLHGHTLGLTRVLFTHYLQAYGDYDAPYIFDDKWTNAKHGVGTLIGILEDHQTLSSIPVEEPDKFHRLYEKLEVELDELQHAYWDSLTAEEKYQYGWILSVWGPNMVDHTQLTVTTYL